MDYSEYMQRREQINRRYHAVQRRTLLYGALAVALAMFISVWFVRYMNMTAMQAGILGGCLGIIAQQTSHAIAQIVTRDA